MVQKKLTVRIDETIWNDLEHLVAEYHTGRVPYGLTRRIVEDAVSNFAYFLKNGDPEAWRVAKNPRERDDDFLE